MLEQYTIADILSWMDEKTLSINREYQRSNKVWTTPAKAYLIDTILRGYPIPKIYLRTRIDSRTRRAYREVVDGQQRLVAIRSYVNDEFALGTSKEIYGDFAGLKYSDLEEAQNKVLEYMIPVEQLMNVPDPVIFDIFQRLNVYNYNLSSQELRHGKYHGAFRNSVVEASRRWEFLWNKYPVLGSRARIRMADDELMAQMFGILIEGVTDGGQPRINNLYKKYNSDLPSGTTERIDGTVRYMIENFDQVLGTEIGRAPHFLMLFAAVAHALSGIPAGNMGDQMPTSNPDALADIPNSVSNLSVLSEALEQDIAEVPNHLKDFKEASSSSTQRIRSRRIRFPMYYRSLLPLQI